MVELSGGAIAGICIGSYVVFATLLVRAVPFRWTDSSKLDLLRKRFPYSMRHSSHRGGSLFAPENTIFAFERAIQEGHTDLLEMDVNISADGVPVVSHDLSLERICDAPSDKLLVSDLVVGSNPDESLPQLKRRIALHFPSEGQGAHYDAEVTAGCSVPRNSKTRLCTLAEVFDAFPKMPIHLDVKSPSEALTHKVVDMIEAYNRQHITIVGSAKDNVGFLHDALAMPPKVTNDTRTISVGQSEKQEPRAPLLSCGMARKTRRETFRTFASFGAVLKTYLLFYTGLLPLVPLDYDAFSILMPTEVKQRIFLQMGGGGCLAKVALTIIMFLLKSPTLWNHLQRRGIAVIGWVLNDESEFKEASQWPINGLMTDDPIALRTFFETHGSNGMRVW